MCELCFDVLASSGGASKQAGKKLRLVSFRRFLDVDGLFIAGVC